MQEAPPHLRAVPPSKEPSAAPSAEVTVVEEDQTTPTWAWLALVGFLICAVGWGVSHREGLALGQTLADTQAELAATQADLTAHQVHLDDVRVQSDALAGRVEAIALEARVVADRAQQAPVSEAPTSEVSPGQD